MFVWCIVVQYLNWDTAIIEFVHLQSTSRASCKDAGSGGAVDGWEGRTLPQILADQLTLSQPEGTDYGPHITTLRPQNLNFFVRIVNHFLSLNELKKTLIFQNSNKNIVRISALKVFKDIIWQIS